MENIAILTGGDSAEYNISLLSANTVLKHLDKLKYRAFIVHLKDGRFEVLLDDKKLFIDKTDFSFILSDEKMIFKKIFMALHGPPAENGQIQHYFDNLKIPYNSCKAKVSALTFDKYEWTKFSVGSFKQPFGLEVTTACHSLTTIDRSIVSDQLVAPQRDLGLMMLGGTSQTKFRYSVALRNGTGLGLKDNNTNFTFEQKEDKIGFKENIITVPSDSSYNVRLFKEIFDFKATRPSLVSGNKIAFG